MKKLSIILSVVGVAALAVFSMTAPAQAKNWRIPDILKVPEGHRLLLRAHARGVQKYACPVSANSAAVPHAILFHRGEGDLVAIHFGGPTWQALDGNSVVGDAGNAKHFKAPDEDAIDWLLIPVKSKAGPAPGLFGKRLLHPTALYGWRETSCGGLRQGADRGTC